MAAQVNPFERNPGQRNAGLDDLIGVADDRQYAAMMNQVTAPIEQTCTAAFHGDGGRVDRCRIAAFRKVRHDLKERHAGVTQASFGALE
jgi:hypothetical protein